MNFEGVSKFGISAKNWGIWAFKFSFASLFIIYIVLHAVSLGIQEKDMKIVIIEIGKEALSPLVIAQENAKEILEQESFNGFSAIWKFWEFYYSLYLIYLWLSLFARIVDATPITDMKVFTNWTLAILFYLWIQTVYILVALKLPYNTPFIAVWDIIRASLHLIANTNWNFSLMKTGEIIQECAGEVCTA